MPEGVVESAIWGSVARRAPYDRLVEREPVEFEVHAFDVGAPVFLNWAGPMADVRLLYGPDPILGVDEPGRRGYLIDDVYLAVAWVAEGAPELANAFENAGVGALRRRAERPTSEELLDTVMRTGSPARPTGDH